MNPFFPDLPVVIVYFGVALAWVIGTIEDVRANLSNKLVPPLSSLPVYYIIFFIAAVFHTLLFTATISLLIAIRHLDWILGTISFITGALSFLSWTYRSAIAEKFTVPDESQEA